MVLLLGTATGCAAQIRSLHPAHRNSINIAPYRGPIGTLVTLTGGNFTALESASIGGRTALVINKGPHAAQILVMPGTSYDRITLVNAGITQITADFFTVIPAEPISQQIGSKFLGTGAVGASLQGVSIGVSAEGNTAILGGLNDNSNRGAAWVFSRDSNQWSQNGGKLLGSSSVGQSYEGTSVALSADGNTAITGGTNDNANLGAAWVYTKSASGWAEESGKLLGTGAAGPAQQGKAVALSADGNTAVVTGHLDNSFAGAAWVYSRTSGSWVQQGGKLTGTGASGTARQGVSVAISADGNTLVMGGSYDNSNVGAAWIFVRTSGGWIQQGPKLVGSGAIGPSTQGHSVAVSADGNTVLIGGHGDDSFTGSTWVFVRTGTTWIQQGMKLTGTGATGAAQQGKSVSISADGNTALVGGNADNGYFGAAWIFARANGVWAEQGMLTANGALGSSQFGLAVSLSANGEIALVGGPIDNGGAGAVWSFGP